MNNLASSTITVAAGATQLVAATGKIFSCLSAGSSSQAGGSSFQLSFDNSQFFLFQGGSTIEVEQPFSQLYFQNTGTVDIVITFYVGTAKVSNSGLFVKNAPTGLFSGGPYVLTAGSNQPFAGSRTGSLNARQWVIVNLSSTIDIQLYSYNAATGGIGSYLCTIFARSSFTIETSDGITIKNPGASSVTVDVFTISYTA